MHLALFDLDHTLLTGDSDVLWCEFLVEHGLLDASFRERNAEMERQYAAGTVSPEAFCSFFASTLAGRGPAFWAPWRTQFLERVIRPRIPADARRLLQRHREAGDTLVLTTATHRVITELTAVELGLEHLIATEVELVDGVYTGRTQGVLNMRGGKVERLQAWLPLHGGPSEALGRASFYSDSINDLPLLSAVGQPVAVDPDHRLEAAARDRGWPVLRFDRGV
jgi:HAD superfamily hydrolase (TIGR01490 family)